MVRTIKSDVEQRHYVFPVAAEADDEGVGTAIVVTLLVLLAVGIVVDQLLRLRKWLNRPPSRDEPEPPA